MSNHKVGKQLRMTIAGEVKPRAQGRTATAWWIPLLVVLGIWRHVRHHWPLSYEPALWSVVFPLGMYSVATLTFGKVAHLAFMEPLSRWPPRSSPGTCVRR